MLTLSRTLYDQLRAHGEETYPHECCGILLGHAVPASDATGEPARNEVLALTRAGNTRTDSAHNRYNISPLDLIRAQREGRAQGLDIVGFYHSHPDHPAQWSPTDLAEAHWYGCSYVITAVAGNKTTGKANDTHSFLLTGTSEEDKAFQDESIAID